MENKKISDKDFEQSEFLNENNKIALNLIIENKIKEKMLKSPIKN